MTSESECPCLSGDTCRLTDLELNELVQRNVLRHQEKEFLVRGVPFLGLFFTNLDALTIFNRVRHARARQVAVRHNAKHMRWGAQTTFFFGPAAIIQELNLYN